MWNWADDNGVGSANERELLGFAFPNDPDITIVDLRRMLVEIRRAFGVDFYTVAGRPYYTIPSWDKHQKFDRRSKGKYPAADKAETHLYLQEQEDSMKSHESPSSTRRDSVAGTGEQGNRGTGEEELKTPATATPRRKIDYPDDFNLFWEQYPKKVSKDAALKAWKAATRRAPAADIIAGAQRYAANPTREPKFTKDPDGWLNAGKWADEPEPPKADPYLKFRRLG
jgi:hypothetical protein